MDAAEEALSHCQITSLLSLYYQALDAGDLETLGSEVMSEDATWEMIQRAGDDRVEDLVSGRREILTWFESMLSSGVSMTEGGVRHFLNTHVIRIAPDGESARSTSHLQAVDTATMAIVAVGFAEGEHVRTREGWRIRRYRIEERITAKDMAVFKARD